MKNIILLLILFVGVKSFSQSAENIVVRNIPISYKTEKSNCYITEILTIGKKTYITVDFIQVKESIDDETGMEGYKIVNNNPKKRTYLITNQTDLTSPYNTSTKSTINDIIEQSKDRNNFFVISASNGKVISLYVNGAG